MNSTGMDAVAVNLNTDQFDIVKAAIKQYENSRSPNGTIKLLHNRVIHRSASLSLLMRNEVEGLEVYPGFPFEHARHFQRTDDWYLQDSGRIGNMKAPRVLWVTS